MAPSSTRRAGSAPEVGLEQRAAGADAGDRLVGEREGAGQPPQEVELGVLEAAPAVGLVGDDEAGDHAEGGAGSVAHREREVVGHAVVAHEPVKQRELALLVIVPEPPAQLVGPGLDELVEGAPPPLLLVRLGPSRVILLQLDATPADPARVRASRVGWKTSEAVATRSSGTPAAARRSQKPASSAASSSRSSGSRRASR